MSDQAGTPSDGHQAPPGSVRKGGATVGAVLVAAGVVILAAQFLPFTDLMRLWPLILVVIGAVRVVRGLPSPHRSADGLGSIALGVVLLASTLGYRPWTIWVSVISLWPVALVAAGLDLIGKSIEREWLRVASSLLFTGALLYGAFVMPAGSWGMPLSMGAATDAFRTDVVASEPAASGAASVEAGGTKLRIGAGEGLASIRGVAARGARPSLQSRVVGDVAEVDVTQPRRSGAWIGTAGGADLDVRLGRGLRWDRLMVRTGAVSADVDLRDLHVRTVEAQVGATDLVVSVGSGAPTVTVDIQAGVSAITVRVPHDARVDVSLDGAFTATSMPSGFRLRSGNTVIGSSRWTAAGTPGGPTVDISVQAGLAGLTIERY